MQPEAWRQMRLPWMRWPRRCCMSLKRRDCSQLRDASQYLRGSTSFFPRHSHRQRWRPGGVRLLYQPVEPQRRYLFSALLCTTYSPPPTDTTRVAPVPSEKTRYRGRSGIRRETTVAHPANISSVAGYARLRQMVISVAAVLHLPGLNPHSVKMKKWRCHWQIYYVIMSYFLSLFTWATDWVTLFFSCFFNLFYMSSLARHTLFYHWLFVHIICAKFKYVTVSDYFFVE